MQGVIDHTHTQSNWCRKCYWLHAHSQPSADDSRWRW